MTKSFLQLIRIKDWLKNIILFLPLIFSGQISNFEKYIDLFYAFIIFSLSASVIYIINDIVDIKSDRLHPIKKLKKPLANKSLTLNHALFILFILFLIISILIFLKKFLIYHLLIYLFLNVLYSFVLKKIAFIDLLVLSFGYIIRLDVGSITVNVESSSLMIATIFSLSFYVLSLKRFAEFKRNRDLRQSLKFYSVKKLYFLIIISAISFFISFIAHGLLINDLIIYTLPLVIYLFFRYYKKAIKDSRGEFPIDIVLKDKILLLSSTFVIIYFLLIYY